MSRHIDFAFDRMNIKQICHFILFGVEDSVSSDNSLTYGERIKQVETALNARLAALYSIDREELTMLSDDISTYKEVYFEMGIRAGERLMIELLNDVGINNLKGD